MSIEEYCPKIVEGNYAEMLVELKVCPICHANMLPEYHYSGYDNAIFPFYNRIAYHQQLKNAGWHLMSDIKVDDKCICKDCAEGGKADFLCALCQKRKPSNKKKESFGDSPEFLCTDCYESVSAKVWLDKEDDLEAKHRYDFE